MVPEWGRHLALLCIVLVTCAAFVPSLRDPLLSDDYILIHAPAEPTALIRTFNQPAGDGAMRPVGEFMFGTYKLWAGGDPVRWHLLGLALHVVNTMLVYWLCRRLFASGYADLLACALFALHAAHPEAVAWTSATFDLLATMFSLLTLIALTCEAKVVVYAAAPCLTALAILSKESAYVLPAIGFCVLAGRRRSVYPCALVAIALFVHRWQVFHGPGGYLDANTGHAQILSVTLLSAVKTLVYRPWWPLLAPVDWAVPPSVGFRMLLGIAYGALGVLALVCRPAGKTVLWLPAAVSVALIPPIHLALIGSDLQNTRVFYLPSVFFCLWFSRIGSRHLGLAAVMVVFSFCALRHNLAIRSQVAEAGGLACRTAGETASRGGGAVAVEGLPGSVSGVFFLANGFEQCVREASGLTGARVVSGGAGTPVLRWDARSNRLEPGAQR